MTDLSLLQDFIAETVEHLEEMEGNLLQLEKTPGDRDTLNDIFRSVHTIKGAAEYLGMERIAELSHRLENLLDLLRTNGHPADRETIDLLMAARDRIGLLAADVHHSRSEQTAIDDLLAMIETAGRHQTALPAPETDASPEAEQPASLILPESDIYEEEHDEELFSIFLEQLRESLDAIQSWTGALSGADRVDRSELLGRCLKQLDPLRSSANYMGYDTLTAFYDQWQAAIQTARKRLDDGEEAFLPQFTEEDMLGRIETIAKTFPRLNIGEPVASTAADTEEDTFSFIDGDSLREENDATAPPAPHTAADEMAEDLFTAIHPEDTPSELNLFPAETAGAAAGAQAEKGKTILDPGLLQDFIAETVDHLGEMESSLLHLESAPDDRESLNNVFRSVHTIKGAAEYMGMTRMAELAHHLESLLDQLRKGDFPVQRDIIDLVMAARDRLGSLTVDLDQTECEQTEIDDLLSHIRSRRPQETDATTNAVETDQGPHPANISAGLHDEPENEHYDEENDEELFGIFLEQLQEGLDAIQSWTNHLQDADRKECIDLLKRCLVQIDPLRSSANYMGYRKLTGVYDRWSDAIRTACDRLDRREDGFMHAFIAGCMQATVDDIRRCFPHLTIPDHASRDPEDEPEAAMPPGAGTAPPQESEADLLDAFADIPEAASSRMPPGAPDGATASADSLFDRLSQSFDRCMADNDQEAIAAAASGMAWELFSDGRAAKPDIPEVWSHREADPQTEDSLEAYAAQPEASIREAAPEPLSTGDDGTMTSPVGEPAPSLADLDASEDIAVDSLTTSSEEDTEAPAMEEEAPPAVVLPSDTVEETGPEPAALPMFADEDTPPAATPDMTSPLNLDRSPGDRQDSSRQGRRKSDRIGEQLLRKSIRVDASKIDALMNQVGELVVSRAWFSQLFHEMRDLQQNLQHHTSLDGREMKQVKGLTFRLSEATVALGRVANELQEGVMKVRMLPIAQLFNRYPRLVFDLVREGDKKVSLDIEGEETELDKMVIESISDPLIHIIRNAVDHGIEPTEERRALGKPESGTIHLEAYHEGNHVVIEIADDGRGLDTERIKAKALAGRFASQEEIERMAPKELNALIMQAGFSTAAEVTHTSGRGVGMDVVKQNIEKLNGTIEIDTTPGVGTQFRIKIPLTLAIIPALLVQVGGELFTIPLSTVEETIRLLPQDLSTIEGVEVMQLRETTLPLVRLAELFKMPSPTSGDQRAFVVVVSTGMKQVGLVVDALLGQEEVVIKPLEDYLQEKSGFSGATILGDGRISLILDIYELVNLSIDRQSQRQKVALPA